MQDAYFQEKNDVGTWFQIGYSAPGTKNSAYSYYSTVFYYNNTDNTADWIAVPRVNLNDCEAGTENAWKMEASLNGTAGQAVAFGLVPSGDDDCLALTASWDGLSRASGTGD